MRTQYASVPNHDEDAEHELEQAFAISDDEDADDDRAHHQSTPLLQHTARSDRDREHEVPVASRTPHSTRTPQTQQPVIDGRYNFEYDFPPPGSPPTNLAGPNHWGNTNGVLVTQPVSPPDLQPSWLTRTWRRVTGAPATAVVVPGRPVGGGTSNDGVFANLSSRPTGSRAAAAAAAAAGAARNPNEPESVFHAPEIALDDAPPSYLAAQLDAAPPYWDNTVLATTPDEFLIDSIPAGSLFGFLWSFLVSLSLQWIGFALAYMLSSSHAGRFGAKAGLGITFVQLGLWFRERGKNPNELANDIWWPTDDNIMWNTTIPVPATTGTDQPTPTPAPAANSTWPSQSPSPWVDSSKVYATDWLALFLMTMGWFMFMSSVLGYWRVKRWEQSLRASAPPRVAGPEGIPPPRRRLGEEDFYANLMRAYAIPASSPPLPPLPNTATGRVERDLALALARARDSSRARDGTHPHTVPNDADDDDDDIPLSNLEAAPLTVHQRIEIEDEIEHAVDQRLRRDLSSLGYL